MVCKNIVTNRVSENESWTINLYLFPPCDYVNSQIWLYIYWIVSNTNELSVLAALKINLTHYVPSGVSIVRWTRLFWLIVDRCTSFTSFYLKQIPLSATFTNHQSQTDAKQNLHWGKPPWYLSWSTSDTSSPLVRLHVLGHTWEPDKRKDNTHSRGLIWWIMVDLVGAPLCEDPVRECHFNHG